MQIVCSTQSSVRRWGPISYHYLEPHAEGLSCGYRFTSTFIRQTRMMIYRQPTQGGGPSKNSLSRHPVGAVVTMIIGFNWGGWSIESTAAKRADEASKSAIVAVLAPICVDKFQHSSDAANNFVELKK